MTLSMTGFGSTTLTLCNQDNDKDTKNTSNNLTITFNLKTLNSRFFEAHFKLPSSLSYLETKLYKYFKKNLYRGNIYFNIYIPNFYALNSSIAPNLNVTSEYIKALSLIKDKFKLKDDISMHDIINLPNIFQTQESQIKQEVSDKILNCIYELVEKVTQMRMQEGNFLKDDLLKRINKIESYLKELKPRAECIISKKKEQIQDNLNLLRSSNTESNTELLENPNIFYQLDKSDIHEEIVRFDSHINNFISSLNSEKIEKGKKLDFILQELFREINTIGSKCSDSIISNLVINIKVELEKSREQVQNIV